MSLFEQKLIISILLIDSTLKDIYELLKVLENASNKHIKNNDSKDKFIENLEMIKRKTIINEIEDK